MCFIAQPQIQSGVGCLIKKKVWERPTTVRAREMKTDTAKQKMWDNARHSESQRAGTLASAHLTVRLLHIMSLQRHIDHCHASPCASYCSGGRVLRKPMDLSDASGEKPVNTPAVCASTRVACCSSLSAMQEFLQAQRQQWQWKEQERNPEWMCISTESVCACVCGGGGSLHHCHTVQHVPALTPFNTLDKDKATGVWCSDSSRQFSHEYWKLHQRHWEKNHSYWFPGKHSPGWGLGAAGFNAWWSYFPLRCRAPVQCPPLWVVAVQLWWQCSWLSSRGNRVQLLPKAPCPSSCCHHREMSWQCQGSPWTCLRAHRGDVTKHISAVVINHISTFNSSPLEQKDHTTKCESDWLILVFTTKPAHLALLLSL